MKKISVLLVLLLICTFLAPTACADSTGMPTGVTQGTGATPALEPDIDPEMQAEAASGTQPTTTTETPTTTQPGTQPAVQPETPPADQPTVQPTAPSTPPRSNGGSSGGSGYASPIVNIEAIEVPLDDGTSIVLPFLDVPQDAYYTEGVAWAYSHDPQITDGVNAERFDPLGTCTRGQMVTFLWRAAGCPEPSSTASGFSDVAAGSWYEKAVAWAVENRITDGVGDGRFAPNGIVNRAQAVTFLYRAKGSPAVAADSGFTDVAAGVYYENAVAWAVANGVTDGVGDNAFAPNNNCVRGQTVTFLYRAYK